MNKKKQKNFIHWLCRDPDSPDQLLLSEELRSLRPRPAGAAEPPFRPNNEPEVKAAVEKAAADDDRTMAQWVERPIIRALREHGYLPKP